MNTAKFIQYVTVMDPDTKRPVDIAIYKDAELGGMFGVDVSYLITLRDEDPVNNPFNGEEITLV